MAVIRLLLNPVFANDYVTLYNDEVRFRDGTLGRFLRVVESGGDPGVAALALCGDAVALVHTYRYPIEAWEWGIPRGFAHGGSPEESIQTELAEELGHAPESIEPLGTMTPNSGLLSSVVHLFVAHYRTTVASPGSMEVAEMRWTTRSQLLDDIASGRIVDGFTLAAVGLGIARGVLPARLQ
jgi:8-oxo-dGTP pyrophosphatase MutT (NUDIX family)